MELKLGLRDNWKQFLLLVIVNGFVGGMLGIERTLLPVLAKDVYGIKSFTTILAFIVVFGIVKAVANLLAGKLAATIGKKNLLVMGWLAAIPVPFILIYAPSWNWILLANIFLGINQGLCWSVAVMMKIDLVGQKNRGFAMGLNEFSGYLSLAGVAFLTGYLASHFGIKPYPFYLGIFFSLFGLFISYFLIKDTSGYVILEDAISQKQKVSNIFNDITFVNPQLSTITQAGLINNLNDALIWGLFPLFLHDKGLSFSQIGIVVAIYPAVWGVTQLYTGFMADKWNHKSLLFWGMLLQGGMLFLIPLFSNFYFYCFISIMIGLGTAMVYPTFLAAIADNMHPSQRGEGIGIFRFWRDSGYVFGALITGVMIDHFIYAFAIYGVGILTLISAFLIYWRMKY